jgi:hypothetical protein
MEAFRLKFQIPVQFHFFFEKQKSDAKRGGEEARKREKKNFKSLFWFELCNRFPLILCTAEKEAKEKEKWLKNSNLQTALHVAASLNGAKPSFTQPFFALRAIVSFAFSSGPVRRWKECEVKWSMFFLVRENFHRCRSTVGGWWRREKPRECRAAASFTTNISSEACAQMQCSLVA